MLVEFITTNPTNPITGPELTLADLLVDDNYARTLPILGGVGGEGPLSAEAVAGMFPEGIPLDTPVLGVALPMLGLVAFIDHSWSEKFSTAIGYSYLDIYNSMISFVEPPDLLIYLKADIPKLVQQISKRNRDFEFNIKLEYLKNLNEHYEKWIASYKHRILVIDVNNLDYVSRIEDFAFVVSKVDFELNNLFS